MNLLNFTNTHLPDTSCLDKFIQDLFLRKKKTKAFGRTKTTVNAASDNVLLNAEIYAKSSKILLNFKHPLRFPTTSKYNYFNSTKH